MNNTANPTPEQPENQRANDQHLENPQPASEQSEPQQTESQYLVERASADGMQGQGSTGQLSDLNQPQQSTDHATDHPTTRAYETMPQAESENPYGGVATNTPAPNGAPQYGNQPYGNQPYGAQPYESQPHEAQQYEPQSYAAQSYDIPTYGYAANASQSAGDGAGNFPPNGNSGQFAQYPAGAAPQPAKKPASGWKRVAIAAGSAFALVLAGGFGGVAVGTALADGANQQTIEQSPSDSTDGGSSTQGDSGQGYPWDGQSGQQGQNGQQLPYTGGSSTDSEIDASAASDSESEGIVIIETVLGYQSAEAAGTGIVLSSDGLVLTNNHVVEGSTEIAVTTADGETYTATVVGTDSTEDIAVLQLEDASNLTTATIDTDNNLAVGDEIAAVGNAQGGGELLTADGVVTNLNASVTTTSQSTLEPTETLNDMIEIDADVVSGDSGGAVLDAEGEVVGVTTAASSGTANITGYAIYIDDALNVAENIVNGVETDTNTIGTPAFLGIALSTETSSQRGTQQQTSGATIAGVYEDTPAAELGLAAGDTITAIDGINVGSASELSGLIAEYTPGTEITVTWTTNSGESTSGTTTLMAGPAD